jgi:hypothetical protein
MNGAGMVHCRLSKAYYWHGCEAGQAEFAANSELNSAAVGGMSVPLGPFPRRLSPGGLLGSAPSRKRLPVTMGRVTIALAARQKGACALTATDIRRRRCRTSLR